MVSDRELRCIRVSRTLHQLIARFSIKQVFSPRGSRLLRWVGPERASCIGLLARIEVTDARNSELTCRGGLMAATQQLDPSQNSFQNPSESAAPAGESGPGRPDRAASTRRSRGNANGLGRFTLTEAESESRASLVKPSSSPASPCTRSRRDRGLERERRSLPALHVVAPVRCGGSVGL